MNKPKRIQMERGKSFQLPPKTFEIYKHSEWANPYLVKPNGYKRWKIVLHGRFFSGGYKSFEEACQVSVENYRRYLDDILELKPDYLEPLRGFNLASWCHIEIPHYIDVILERLYD